MRNVADRLEVMDQMLSGGASRGVLQLRPDGVSRDGRMLELGGRAIANFGSCSYLGLERDPRLEKGLVEAAQRFGTQFSASRAYVSVPLYDEVEDLLGRIFDSPVLVTPSTSLGHMAALPVLIGERDAIVLDQQVHHSVQTATHLARVQGTRIEVVRHNRLDDLEDKIRALRQAHPRIWYLADGIYSMFGDPAPLADLTGLLKDYPCLHLYVDDAHGMSWSGLHGRGFAAGRLRHPRVFYAVSLNKAFAAAGGALVFPDAESRRRVRTLGGPMIFSGPVQPPMLGAAAASARIHLSPDMVELQGALAARVQCCQDALSRHGLRAAAVSEAPIRFVEIGLPRDACTVVEALLRDGFYTNVAMFPAVPMRRAGVRFTVTLHHDPADYDRLIAAVARRVEEVKGRAGAGGLDRKTPWIVLSGERTAPPPGPSDGLELTVAPALRLEHHRSVKTVDAAEWDGLLGDRGSFTCEGLRFLEETFRGSDRPEDNWNFHYLIVRDASGSPVLATFLSDALWKDDMLAPDTVSAAVETRRRDDRYFLTTRTLAMGSLLTEGDHLYLDRTRDWKGAMQLLLDAMAGLREGCDARLTVLRDLPAKDDELAEFLLESGFARFPAPESLVADLDWRDEAEWLARLSHTARRHQRLKTLPWNGAYDLEVLHSGTRKPSDEELRHLHGLYRNVRERNLGLNTFELPPWLFERMLSHPGWEIALFRLRTEFGGSPGAPPAGFMASYVGKSAFIPLIVGMDYHHVDRHGLYRQILRQMLVEGRRHGARRVLLGMGATFEKTRFGAKVESRYAYIQAEDHDHAAVLDQLWADAARTTR